MSNITRIKSKTWVLSKSPKNIENYKSRLNTATMLGIKVSEENFTKTPKKRKHKEYKKFLKDVFKDRKMISEKYLNSLILEKFGASTWYRKRFIELGMITSNNGIVKLTEEF